jgi:hypothetical protein
VAGVLAAAPFAGPAPAAEAAACSGTSGVTVVVDFGSLGGGVRVSCAPGDPASGLSALSGAGFGYSFVPRQPGLVCQINAKPDPCNGAPTNAYWSYWHASRGGSWSYSTVGAGSYDPRAGTVEGWAFGAGGRPGVAPPAAAAPPPQPPPPKPTVGPTTRAPVPPAPPGSTSRPRSSVAPSSRPRATTPPPGSSAATTAPGSPTGTTASTDPAGAGGTPSDPAVPPASPATRPVGSSSGLARSALGAAVVVALAAAGFVVARRRVPPTS